MTLLETRQSESSHLLYHVSSSTAKEGNEEENGCGEKQPAESGG